MMALGCSLNLQTFKSIIFHYLYYFLLLKVYYPGLIAETDWMSKGMKNE